jgi:P pilus assembly chaperone PapD
MRRVMTGISAAAAIVILCSSAAHAGVVLSETRTTAGPNGKESQDRTIYVQGNKQKIETQTLQVITDLDKRVVYVVNPQ